MFVTDEWLRDRAGVHRSTVARWRAQGRFPAPIERLAQIELEGRLELVHDAWIGWRINSRTGELVAPGGMTYTPAELLAVPIRWQLMRELERRVAIAPVVAEPRPTLMDAIARVVRRLSRVARPDRSARARAPSPAVAASRSPADSAARA